MIWTQLKVTCKVTELDTVSAVMSVLDPSIMIEDYSDIETGLKTVYGDLIDESILNSDKSIAACSIYVPEDKNINEYSKGQNFRTATTTVLSLSINDSLPYSLFLRGLVMSGGMPGTFFLMYEHKLHITT